MNKLNPLFCSLGLTVSLLAAGSACATDLTGAGATKGFDGKTWNSGTDDQKKLSPLSGPKPVKQTKK